MSTASLRARRDAALQLAHRIRAARRLLEACETIAAIAAATGFATRATDSGTSGADSGSLRARTNSASRHEVPDRAFLGARTRTLPTPTARALILTAAAPTSTSEFFGVIRPVRGELSRGG
jgi:hypothetical protein